MHLPMRKTKLFLDTNVLLDLFFDRPYETESLNCIMQMGLDNMIENCISVLSLPTLAYAAESAGKKSEVEPKIRSCHELFTILPVDGSMSGQALAMKGNDYEDKLQMACAKSAGCNYIITRDKTGFNGTPNIPVYSPDAFMEHLRMQEISR